MMAYINEPEGIDLVVAPMPFTKKDRQTLSDIISHFKKTGEVPQQKEKVNRTKKQQPRPSKNKLPVK